MARKEIPGTAGSYLIEATSPSVMVLFTVLTAFAPTWIEAVFHVDPDAGNGMFELVILAGVALATVAFGIRRIRTAPRGTAGKDGMRWAFTLTRTSRGA